MSPHAEYWGIPSPTEVLCCAPETESLQGEIENENMDRSRSSARDTNYGERESDSVPEA